MTTGRPTGTDVLAAALAAMACATTGLCYGAFFATSGYLTPVLTSAAVSALLVGVLVWRRVRILIVLAAVVIGFLIFAVIAIYYQTTAFGDLLPAVFGGVIGGWTRMLASGLPADVTPDLIVTPALVTWMATATATLLALRTRIMLAPLVPVVLAYTAGLLLTAERGGSGLPVAALVLSTSMFMVLARASRSEERGTVPAGSVRSGIPTVVAALALAALAASTIPVANGEHRFDPRNLLAPRVEITEQLSPLVLVKPQLREPNPRLLFKIQMDDGAPTLIRTAALDRFDGSLWTSGDTFLRSGHTLAPDPDFSHAATVTADIVIEDLAGPYLPVLGRPAEVTLSGAGFSDDSGVLVSDRPTLRGLAYTLVSRIPKDDGSLANTPPETAEGLYTALPTGLPDVVAVKVRELTDTAQKPYAKLTAIEDYLRSLPYSLDALPGHSYAAVSRMLDAPEDSRIGYAEQHASAFAIMARSLGYPSRVATGYRLKPERYRAGGYDVTSHEAHAWAEVKLSGYGWVPFDPTNLGDDIKPRVTEPTEQEPIPTPGVDPDKGADTGRVNQNLPAPQDGWSWTSRVLVLVLVCLPLLVVVLLLLSAAAKRWRRRKRRTTGSSADRVVGAWRESIDRLIAYGVTVSPSMTATQTGVQAHAAFGAVAASVPPLAELATTAVFSAGLIEPAAATLAWDLDTRFGVELRHSHGRVRALRALLDPRPLASRLGGRVRHRERT